MDKSKNILLTNYTKEIFINNLQRKLLFDLLTFFGWCYIFYFYLGGRR